MCLLWLSKSAKPYAPRSVMVSTWGWNQQTSANNGIHLRLLLHAARTLPPHMLHGGQRALNLASLVPAYFWMSAAMASVSEPAGLLSTTAAATNSPYFSSGAAKATASATRGWPSSALSTCNAC